MTRAERIVLAIVCLAAGPALSALLLLPPLGSTGLSAMPFVPLVAFGPTALGVFLGVALLKAGAPRAAEPDPEGAASYRQAPSRSWDGEGADEEPPRGVSLGSLLAVPVLIVLVLLAMGGGLLCLGPIGPE
jgi:hypothetical protein